MYVCSNVKQASKIPNFRLPTTVTASHVLTGMECHVKTTSGDNLTLSLMTVGGAKRGFFFEGLVIPEATPLRRKRRAGIHTSLTFVGLSLCVNRLQVKYYIRTLEL